ncbi:glycosyl hydrolase-related protein [Paenibacillus cisolokensis]|uniref:glycosyl hydrolase-related protein n=1 Tax=Paenibacillus cisolokensis TaxID=1658519 RepID=UPI001FD35028|nr:glycosyl hydrolase-related protein [Paenibacillus cisolokensis]
MYETAGTRAEAELRTDFAVESAWIADLMEQPLEPVSTENGAIALSFAPFEILTVKIRLSATQS